MARGRIYTAHVRRDGAADRDVVFVKEGFAWPAFFFSLLWALWNRMWVFALIVVLGGILIGVVSDLVGLDPVSDAAVGLAWSLLIGFEANDARRRSLARRGFDLAGLVHGAGLVDAEHRFFAKRHHAAASSA